MREQWMLPETVPYTFVGDFAYSLRCPLCRMEVPHSEEEHDILRCGVEVPIQAGRR